MNKYIKKILFTTPALYQVYLNSVLRKHEVLFELKLEGEPFNTLCRSELLNLLKNRKSDADVCHIIGSGRSLNDSANIIREEDFVIGFNYAALSSIKFDAYFFEFGGYKVKNISDNHLALAKDVVSKQTNLIFFKNIWEDKNDIQYVSDNWIEYSALVKDRIYPLQDKRYLQYTVERCFEDDSEYVPQLCSSVMTSLFLAYQAGFKRIIIHGLDFGGLYFYEEFVLDDKEKYLPSIEGELGNYSKSNSKTVHSTASGMIGMKEIIPVAYKYLLRKNIELFCAIDTSPSSNLLPVYKKKEI